MNQANLIRAHMPVICANGGRFATVDRVDGDAIKLTKDERGRHHWIPLAWVTRVDDHVHIDRSGDRAMREWSATPLGGGLQTPMDPMSQDFHSPM